MVCRLPLIPLAAVLALPAADWPMFQCVNGSGIATVSSAPAAFGRNKNLVRKTALPFDHSSPVITCDLAFLTAAEGGERVGAERGDGWQKCVHLLRRQ